MPLFLGVNYQYSQSSTASVNSHTLLGSANISVSPFETLAGYSNNETLVKYNYYNKEIEATIKVSVHQ